ncbi:MAG: hypothetical protein WC002_06860 [Candidatus Muiribacteriota bacterium]
MSSKRWSKEEEDFLKKNFNKMSNKDLADKFNVTTISVQRKLSRLNLIRQVQKKWSDKEEKYLKENYNDKSDAELAKYFDVTPIAVKRKLNRLGLKRTNRKKTVTKQEAEPKPKKIEVKKVEPVEVEKVIIKPEPVVKKEQPEQPKKTSHVKLYDYTETYEIGDIIYHEIYKDKGKIVEKQTSHDGYELIVVEFIKEGPKVLVENI